MNEALRTAPVAAAPTSTSTEVATRQPKDFPAMLQLWKSSIQAALPSHMNADRMARVALTCFRQNPKLAECEPTTVFAAVVISAQLGLELGIMGQAYLVPYYNKAKRITECQFIPGWRGIVDLVNRSGRASVWTGAVFKGDEFEFEFGTKPYLKHKPCGNDFDPMSLTHVYAIGQVQGSVYPVIEVWPVQKVLRHRDRYNKVGDRHYSHENFEMYGRKVALLQVIKYLPTSIELAAVQQLDDAADRGTQNLNLQDAIAGTFTTVPLESAQEAPTAEQPAPAITAGPQNVHATAAAPATQASASGAIAFYSVESAIKELRAQADVAKLKGTWKAIKADFAGRELPVHVEAVYNERMEALAEDSQL